MKKSLFKMKSQKMKTLCLDLDNTLIFSHQDVDTKSINLNKLKGRCEHIKIPDVLESMKKGEGNISNFLVVFRPHLSEFIEFSLKYFDQVVLWSAGRERYVRAIDFLILPNHKVPVLHFFDCVFKEDGTTFKELIKKNFDLETTLIIDDRSDTMSKNKDNGILIPVYNPNLSEKAILDQSDKSLLKIMKWLQRPEVVNCKDYRKLDKSKIFI